LFAANKARIGPVAVEFDLVQPAVAETIIQRRVGHFGPAAFHDRYQAALRDLIEAKLKGRRITAKQIAEPATVYDLMTALKRSLQQETKAEPPSKKRPSGGQSAVA